LLSINRVALAKAGSKKPRRRKAEQRQEKSTLIETKTITLPDGTERVVPLYARGGALGLGRMADDGSIEFEPLRRIRVIMPWTYFGGPAGIPGDPNRILLYSGSPAWWCVYVACLCVLAVLAIVLHDRESPRRPVLVLAAGVGAAALVAVGLAMWTGVDHTLVNPLPSS